MTQQLMQEQAQMMMDIVWVCSPGLGCAAVRVVAVWVDVEVVVDRKEAGRRRCHRW